jgi:hypothetical protein
MPREEQKSRPLLRRGETLSRKAQKKSGGGDKYHPRTLEQAQRLLVPMTHALREKAQAMPAGLRGERIVFEAELLPNYLAASHHPKQLRKVADLVMVGTKAAKGTLRTAATEKHDQPTKSLLLAGTVESMNLLDELIQNPPSNDEDLLQEIIRFERIELAPAERVIRRGTGQVEAEEDAEEPAWEAVLHPPVDRDGEVTLSARDLVLERWSALLIELGGSLHEDFVRSVGNLLFMPITLSEACLDQAARFNPLRVIRPMPHLRKIGPSELRRLDPAAGEAQPPAVQTPPAHHIAIFDGGIDDSHPLLAPYVKQVHLTDSDIDDEYLAHGMLVTSSALYGHLDLAKAASPPPSSVDHFRVLPRPAGVSHADEVYWVIDQVESILRGGPHKLAVLSYGPNQPVDEDFEPHRFTAVLDRLAYIDGIAFAVAAGNNGQAEVSPLGLDRVQPPADGANVLGVGACIEPGDCEPVRAHYSAVGPGRAGMRVQPMGVCFGGVAGREFIGAAPGGGLQIDAGTSFAAPSAARGLATLIEPLGAASFDAKTARAFAAHFASGCELTDHDLDQLGHGLLSEDYLSHLDCAPTEITILIEDTLKRGQTKSFPFPVPPGGLSGKVAMRWTPSFISPTDEEEAVEYTLAGLEVDMRPHKERHTINPPRGSGLRSKVVNTRTDKGLIAKLEGEDWKLSKNAKTRSGDAYRSEQTQSEEGKWETVVRHDASMLASSLHQPEVWVTYLERAQGELVDAADSIDLDFAMLMTITAPRVVDLYETIAASARYSTLVPIALPVQIDIDAT